MLTVTEADDGSWVMHRDRGSHNEDLSLGKSLSNSLYQATQNFLILRALPLAVGGVRNSQARVVPRNVDVGTGEECLSYATARNDVRVRVSQFEPVLQAGNQQVLDLTGSTAVSAGNSTRVP